MKYKYQVISVDKNGILDNGTLTEKSKNGWDLVTIYVTETINYVFRKKESLLKRLLG